MKDKLDSLLKEKYARERKEAWKREIPIPKDMDGPSSAKSSYVKFAVGLIGFVGLVSIFFFFKSTDNQTRLVDDYIYSTPIAALDENVSRGQVVDNLTTEETTDVAFAKAAQLIKQADPNYAEAIKLLEPFALEKNKYQQEALWLKSLAHAKLDQKKRAISELNKLQAISNYQKDKIIKLIPFLKS